eukprot:1153510-Pelagomonas_calceolata.AAC.5
MSEDEPLVVKDVDPSQWPQDSTESARNSLHAILQKVGKGMIYELGLEDVQFLSIPGRAAEQGGAGSDMQDQVDGSSPIWASSHAIQS